MERSAVDHLQEVGYFLEVPNQAVVSRPGGRPRAWR